ncbi:MAG: hypothetical protein PHD76_10570 [Methylacidiphilales bacterium]|nr:hypothetical protein [Candidatus Methylacidiphilales bacterium]
MAPSLSATQPAWWTARGAVSSSLSANDYAVVNQGQLKQFTQKAVQEMNVGLAGGAGSDLNTLVTGWQQEYQANGWNGTNPKPSDFTVMTVGQLKYIAGKIWSRLVAAGYTASAPSWLAVNAATDNQAANLGQLKTVFNFNLSNFLPAAWQQQNFGHTGVDPNADPDGDGLSNLQEYQGGSDPNNYYNQDSYTITPQVTIVSGNNQTSDPGTFAANPLLIQVTDSATGLPLSNAPITFSVTQGGGKLTTINTPVAQQYDSLPMRTDINGYAVVYQGTTANVYYLQPAGEGIISQISVTAGTGFPAQFTVTTNYISVPADPSNFSVTTNGDGSLTYSWQDNSGNETGFVIQYQQSNGNWVQLGTVGANQTSFTVDAATAAAAGVNGSTNARSVATNPAGQSGGSNQSNPPPPIPSSPTSLSGSFDDSGNMNLSWTPSAGATSYQIERETLSTGTWENLGTATGATYQDTSRTAGTGYHYRVSAINSTGSATSNEFPASSYAVIDLGLNFVPVGINNSGVVAGNGPPDGNPTGAWVPQVWNQGVLTALQLYPGNGVSSSITSIDDSNHITGQILGNVYDSDGNPIGNDSAAGYWTSTTEVPLRIGLGWQGVMGGPNDTGPAIISDEGFIVGHGEGGYVLQFDPSDAPPNLAHLLSDTLTRVDVTGAAGTSSWCGYGYYGPGPVINGTTYTTSPTLHPYAINDSNLVVGGDGSNAKLVQVSGSTLQITNLGSGAAKALNNHTSTISGSSTPTPQIIGFDGPGNGTLWEKTKFDGSSSDTYIKKNLNDLIPTTSGWVLQSPTYSSPCVAINNSALIVGTATYSGSDSSIAPGQHGIMLIPFEVVRETQPGSSQYHKIDQVPLFQGDPRQFGENDTGVESIPLNITPQMTISAGAFSADQPDSIFVHLDGKATGEFNGTLVETGNNTNTFANNDGTVTVVLNSANANAWQAIVSVAALGYSNTPFTLKHTGTNTYASFVQLAEADNVYLDDGAIDTLHISILYGDANSPVANLGQPLAVTAVETGANTRQFVDAANGITVQVLNNPTFDSSAIDVLQCKIYTTTDPQSAVTVELLETGPNTRNFTSQTRQISLLDDHSSEANDPETLGSGVCFVKMPQITGLNSIKIHTSDQENDPGVEVPLQAMPNQPGMMISEPFILLPQDSQKEYAHYNSTTLHNVRSAVSNADHINYNFVFDNAPDTKSGVKTAVQRGLFAAWSVPEMMRGNPEVERHLRGYPDAATESQNVPPDSVIQQDEQRMLNSLANVRTDGDANLELYGNVRNKNLLWADNTDIGDVLRRYDYVLLACHGMTRASHFDFYQTPEAPRVGFQGFVLMKHQNGNIQFQGYTPDDVKMMTLLAAPKLVFLSACGSAENRQGAKTQEMRDAFRSYVYIGWSDEVFMRQAAYAEERFFKEFKEDTTVLTALDRASSESPAKIELADMANHPDEVIAQLNRLEDIAPSSYTAKQLIEKKVPGTVQNP